MISAGRFDTQLKKSFEGLKKSSKKFAFFLTLLLIAVVSIALLYFYIEHCYDPYKVNDQLWQLCQYLLLQGHNNNTNSNVNHTQLIDLCQDVKLPPKIECELTQTNFFKYFDLSGHIAFTVGKYLCALITIYLSLCSLTRVMRFRK